jgi:hypothetical protein
MTERGANNAVVVGSIVTLGSTTASSLTKGNGIHGKTVVGGFFAMAGCAVLTEINPDLGGYLAILIAGGTFVYYGLPLLEKLNKRTKKEEEERAPQVEKEKIERAIGGPIPAPRKR